MKNGCMDFKNILEVILKTINRNANILADSYLIKDASTISKWKSNKLIPRSDDILKIVDFTMNESTGTQRKLIRDRIEVLLSASLLKEDIKSSLLKIEDFQEFLLETLSVSISNEVYDGKCSESTEDAANSETITSFSSDFEGKYSGVVEFNLVLSKDNGEKIENKSGEPGTNFKNDFNFTIKSKLGGLQRQLLGKGVLGMMVIGIVSGFFIFHIANNPQPVANDLKIYAAKEEMKTSTPVPTDTPVPTGTLIPTNTPIPIKASPAEKEDRSAAGNDSNSNAADTKKNNVGNSNEAPDYNINGNGINFFNDISNSSITIEK